MSNNYNYYDILGCTKESTYEDIKRAYHSRVLQFHPDKNNKIEHSLDEFHLIVEAWKTLGHVESRKKYDVACRQEELDLNTDNIYVKLSVTELETTHDETILTYRCRCGSNYYVEKEHLKKNNQAVHVSCQECTFIIVIET